MRHEDEAESRNYNILNTKYFAYILDVNAVVYVFIYLCIIVIIFNFLYK